jgi:HD superfamily phosphohydrolase
MGLSYLVYPGTNHTRFHHFRVHAFDKAVDVLRFKVLLSTEEENALHCYFIARYWAWTFSHAMEKALLKMCIMKKFHCCL